MEDFLVHNWKQTSGYAAENDSAELFAEAFSDVYENGMDAKPMHIEIVKSRPGSVMIILTRSPSSK